MHGLGILIIIVGMGVGAWYFIRSAVASGVRMARRDEQAGDKPGSHPDSPS
jgi:hypothetical protein